MTTIEDKKKAEGQLAKAEERLAKVDLMDVDALKQARDEVQALKSRIAELDAELAAEEKRQRKAEEEARQAEIAAREAEEQRQRAERQRELSARLQASRDQAMASLRATAEEAADMIEAMSAVLGEGASKVQGWNDNRSTVASAAHERGELEPTTAPLDDGIFDVLVWTELASRGHRGLSRLETRMLSLPSVNEREVEGRERNLVQAFFHRLGRSQFTHEPKQWTPAMRLQTVFDGGLALYDQRRRELDLVRPGKPGHKEHVERLVREWHGEGSPVSSDAPHVATDDEAEVA